MITLLFYVVMCSDATHSDCENFIPYVWEYQANNEVERSRAFNECSLLARAYSKLEATKEVDCYIEE